MLAGCGVSTQTTRSAGLHIEFDRKRIALPVVCRPADVARRIVRRGSSVGKIAGVVLKAGKNEPRKS
jgi:hypothetical protein